MLQPARLLNAIVSLSVIAVPSLATAQVVPSHLIDVAYDWKNYPPGLYNLDVDITVTDDPGDDTYYYWSHFVTLDHGGQAYAGLQTNGGTVRKAIFSVWNATSTTSDHCQAFSQQGAGYGCIIDYPWQAGKTYTIRMALVAQDGNNTTWTGSVIDDSTHAETMIGTVSASTDLGRPQASWLYYEYYGQIASCNALHHVGVRFTNLHGNQGIVPSFDPSMYNGVFYENACAEHVKAVTQANNVWIDVGGGVSRAPGDNSVDLVVAPKPHFMSTAGLCLDGNAAYAAWSAGNNQTAPVHLQPCANTNDQLWTRRGLGLSVDGLCLDVGPSAALILYPCTGDAAQGWSNHGSAWSLGNLNQCMVAAGTSPGSSVQLGACDGSSATTWALSPNDLYFTQPPDNTLPTDQSPAGIANNQQAICLSMQPSGNPPAVVTAGCIGTTSEVWQYTRGSLVNRGACLDVANPASDNSALVTRPCNGSWTQRWANVGNAWLLMGTAKCLTLTDGASAVALADCVGSENQAWRWWPTPSTAALTQPAQSAGTESIEPESAHQGCAAVPQGAAMAWVVTLLVMIQRRQARRRAALQQ